MSSGPDSGITNGGQTSFDQFESEQKAKDNEKNVESQLNGVSHVFDSFPKNINEGKQGKHIPGHNNYKKGKSVLNIGLQEAQLLVNKFSGKGSAIGENKERVDFGKVIGKYIDPTTGKSQKTTIGIIHYSKSGTHIVPARPIN